MEEQLQKTIEYYNGIKSFKDTFLYFLEKKLPGGRSDSYFYKPAGMNADLWHKLINEKCNLERERVRIWLLRLCLLMGLDQEEAYYLMASAGHPFANDPLSQFCLICIRNCWCGIACCTQINLFFREYGLVEFVPDDARLYESPEEKSGDCFVLEF